VKTLFAIDWLLDRFRTVVNVTGDLTVTAIVSKRVNEDPQEDTEVVDKLGDVVSKEANDKEVA